MNLVPFGNARLMTSRVSLAVAILGVITVVVLLVVCVRDSERIIEVATVAVRMMKSKSAVATIADCVCNCR